MPVPRSTLTRMPSSILAVPFCVPASLAATASARLTEC